MSLLIPARILCMTVQDDWLQSNKTHVTHTTGQELGLTTVWREMPWLREAQERAGMLAQHLPHLSLHGVLSPKAEL